MKSLPVIFSISWNACINCGVCVAICPQEAGFISDFDTIAVHTPCDIACMICEEICPVDAITHVQAETRSWMNVHAVDQIAEVDKSSQNVTESILSALSTSST